MPISRVELTQKSGRALPLLTISVALALMAACSDKSKDAQPAVPVQIVQVEKTTLQQKVSAEAVLFPIAQSAIVPKISAPVQKFLVNRGSHVRKGQLLAVLENRDLAAAAQENKGAYTQAEATYAITTAADLPQQMQKAELDTQAAKQALDAQQKIYDSRQQLFREGALPRKELDQSSVDLTNARNQYQMAQQHLDSLKGMGEAQLSKSAKGQLESAQGKFQGAEAQLQYSEIRSPISGVVTERPLYPGEMAAAGTPLLTIMDISQVVARAHIPQTEAVLLKRGDNATLSAPGLDEPIPGKVVLVSPALDPNSTTVEIWVQSKNPNEVLRPGTSAQITMVARTVKDALAIPSASLLTAQDGTSSVMVAQACPGNTYVRQLCASQTTVKAGFRDGDRVQILEGLQAGQKIVGNGAYGLPDNSKITAAEANKPEAENQKE
ncbi:MAG TPA: efflux RND transporter periplasmic adaptor subunit [Terriglobales bacterium]|jgi:HlyD family secretion protein|nr:efflux RND transporter periplasmic adaptor subunit [Terriglobales bacterium]